MAVGPAFFSSFLLRRHLPPACSFPPPPASAASLIPRIFPPHSPPPFLLHAASLRMSTEVDMSSSPSLSSFAACSAVNCFPSRDAAHSAAVKAALEAASSSTSYPDLFQCGELACQRDSLRRTLYGAAVLGWAMFEEASVGAGGENGGKGKKKRAKKGGGNNQKKDASECAGLSPPPSSPRCALVLSDSVFFPEGGGQPSDRGRIALIAGPRGGGDGPSNGAEGTEDEGGGRRLDLTVIDARNFNGTCVLTCAPSSSSHSSDGSEGWDSLFSSLLLSSAATTVEQEIDWSTRFDHMTQHSAQHLLSAIAASDEFGNINTVSFSLGRGEADMSYIDFEVGSDANLDECRSILRRVEERANDCVRQNLSMTPRYLDPGGDEFKERVRSRLLPDGLTGPVRLVEIGDGIDLNTCCGTHVPSLSYLQSVQVFRIERVKGGVVRAHFAAAERLRRIVDNMYARQAEIMALLSCPGGEQAERVKKLLEEKIGREREIKAMRERICALQATDAARECKESGGIAAFDLGGGFDVAYMLQLSAVVMQLLNGEGGSDGALLLFVSSAGDDGASSSNGEEGTFLLTGHVSKVDRLGTRVAEALGGRGGGKNGRYQGKGTKIRSGLEQARLLLAEETKEA